MKNEKRRLQLRAARKRRLREEFVTPYQHLLPCNSSGAANNDPAGSDESERSDGPIDMEGAFDAYDEVGGIADDTASDVDAVSNLSATPSLVGEQDAEDSDADAADYLRERGAQQRQLFRVLGAANTSEDEADFVEAASGDVRVLGDAAVKAVSNFFVGLQARREVPQKVVGDIVDYIRENSDLLSEALKDGKLPTFRTMRNRAVASAPKVLVDVLAADVEGVEVRYEKLSRFPRKDVEERRLQVIYTHYYMCLQDVIDLHQKAHPHRQTSTAIHLSIDGIPESKSSGLSLDVLSIRFYGCDSIYSIGLLQPAKKGVKDKDAILLQPFLADLPETELKLKLVIADAPKRASLQGLKTHASTFGCPYCYARKIEGKFPSSTFRGEERSDAELRRVSEAIAAGEDAGETRGIRGKSLLADVANFDLIHDVPADAMHLVCLGVVRRMMTATYKVGKRQILPFEPAAVAPLNRALRLCRSLAKFSRRTRDFDPAVYKSEEYRNFVLVFWPVILTTAPRATVKIWLLTVYIVRAMCLPNDLYNRLDTEALETALLRKWYVWFEKTFTADQCTYSAHVFSHLDKVRRHGVLSKTSALRYENKYAIIKQNYRSGTSSVGSQVLVTSLFANLTGHNCRPARRYSSSAPPAASASRPWRSPRPWARRSSPPRARTRNSSLRSRPAPITRSTTVATR